MFDSTHPPLLVLPLTMQQTILFPSQGGYNLHFTNDNRVFVSYRNGWTLPLSVQQRKLITEKPLLLVRNKGRITSEGSTFIKGYAHQFVNELGKEPDFVLKEVVFSDNPDAEWMFVPDKVSMIWIQCGFKNQYCVDATFEMAGYHYGKIMIFLFSIVEDVEPRLDKKADLPDIHEKQYRVLDRLLFNESWSLIDEDAQQYLEELLSLRGFENYKDALKAALTRVGF